MNKRTLASIAIAAGLGLSTPAWAQDNADAEAMTGFGAGALAGALVGGPPGALIGGIAGSILGEGYGNRKILEDELAAASSRGSELQARLAAVEAEKLALEQERLRLSEQLARQVLPERELDASLAMDVLFRTGSPELEAGARQQLVDLAETLKALPNLQVRLDGHTDRRGSDEINHTLASARVETVKQLLLSAGVPAERIETRALGASQARAELTDVDGLALDRRVVIQLTTEPRDDGRQVTLK